MTETDWLAWEQVDHLSAIRGELRRVLDDHGSPRAAIEAGLPMDAALWGLAASLGWPAITLPDAFGGLGQNLWGMAVLAEELGRAVAAIPVSAGTDIAAQAILTCGDGDQQARWLTRLAEGSILGCASLPLPGAAGEIGTGSDLPRFDGTALSGTALNIIGAAAADFAVVAASDSMGKLILCLVPFSQSGMVQEPTASLDPSLGIASLTFDGAEAEILPGSAKGAGENIAALVDRAALMTAWEQVGGARAALAMAIGYARQREAFGKSIGSFQAVQHRLARAYMEIAKARACCLAATKAFEDVSADRPLKVAAARISASQAYLLAASDNVLVHGGVGITWELDCQWHYKRSAALGIALGSISQWKRRLLDAKVQVRVPEAAA